MVPEHRLLNEAEAERILKKLGITREQLPKIRLGDPAIRVLEATAKEKGVIQEGKIVEIRRKSKTADTFVAYRLITR
ncbi:MAG: DNA-directed RNA polymerase subunit H [Candidatus Thermoplasmatota archaeon]|nr:DNA-directed RNA polymerase subunit H [Candidatus Thermoplasmatota archaeon]